MHRIKRCTSPPIYFGDAYVWRNVSILYVVRSQLLRCAVISVPIQCVAVQYRRRLWMGFRDLSSFCLGIKQCFYALTPTILISSSVTTVSFNISYVVLTLCRCVGYFSRNERSAAHREEKIENRYDIIRIAEYFVISQFHIYTEFPNIHYHTYSLICGVV